MLGMFEFSVITVPSGFWILHICPPTPSTVAPPPRFIIVVVVQLNSAGPPQGTQVLLGTNWNAEKVNKATETYSYLRTSIKSERVSNSLNKNGRDMQMHIRVRRLPNSYSY